jgi:hypothetical protein
MKRNYVLLGLTMLSLSVAHAASRYSLTLSAPTKVGDTRLEAGVYKVEMKGETAVFTSGKTTTEVPAALETTERKYAETALSTEGLALKEIQLGGTKTKIVIKPAMPVVAVGQ